MSTRTCPFPTPAAATVTAFPSYITSTDPRFGFLGSDFGDGYSYFAVVWTKRGTPITNYACGLRIKATVVQWTTGKINWTQTGGTSGIGGTICPVLHSTNHVYAAVNAETLGAFGTGYQGVTVLTFPCGGAWSTPTLVKAHSSSGPNGALVGWLPTGKFVMGVFTTFHTGFYYPLKFVVWQLGGTWTAFATFAQSTITAYRGRNPFGTEVGNFRTENIIQVKDGCFVVVSAAVPPATSTTHVTTRRLLTPIRILPTRVVQGTTVKIATAAPLNAYTTPTNHTPFLSQRTVSQRQWTLNRLDYFTLTSTGGHDLLTLYEIEVTTSGTGAPSLSVVGTKMAGTNCRSTLGPTVAREVPRVVDTGATVVMFFTETDPVGVNIIDFGGMVPEEGARYEFTPPRNRGFEPRQVIGSAGGWFWCAPVGGGGTLTPNIYCFQPGTATLPCCTTPGGGWVVGSIVSGTVPGWHVGTTN